MCVRVFVRLSGCVQECLCICVCVRVRARARPRVRECVCERVYVCVLDGLWTITTIQTVLTVFDFKESYNYVCEEIHDACACVCVVVGVQVGCG